MIQLLHLINVVKIIFLAVLVTTVQNTRWNIMYAVELTFECTVQFNGLVFTRFHFTIFRCKIQRK